MQKNSLKQKVLHLIEKEGVSAKIENFATALTSLKDKASLIDLFEDWLSITGRNPDLALYDSKKLTPTGSNFVKFIQGFTVTKTDWQNFAQQGTVVKAQIKKMNS